jgi:hypothetical protein
MLQVGATGIEQEEEGVYSICVTNYNGCIGTVLCSLL